MYYAKMIDDMYILTSTRYTISSTAVLLGFQWEMLLYTTANDLITVNAESTDYFVTKDATLRPYHRCWCHIAYCCHDFKDVLDFSYEIYDINWNRCNSQSVGDTTAALPRRPPSSDIRRYQEPILPTLKGYWADDTWTWWDLDKGSTADGIGYVKSKTLGNTSLYPDKHLCPGCIYSHHKDYTINLVWHQVTNQSANSNISTY